MENNTSINPLDNSHSKDTKNTSNSKESKPTIESLDLLNEVRSIEKNISVNKEETLNKFPVDVFPEAIQEIIKSTNECLNYPIDFIGASLLFAVSVAIGNTREIMVKKGYKSTAVLYMSIVGSPGSGKSHPLHWALKPIKQRDNISYKEYEDKKKEYDAWVGLNKKEKKNTETIEKPFWSQHLITDFTPEALSEIHKHNIRGLGVHSDELTTWINNFNRYNKGSEEQFWLSAWSLSPITVQRKTSEPINIAKPFLSVCGTIQPQVLIDLSKNRTDNGFLDRILFVYPKHIEKPYWSDSDISDEINENWNLIINNLIDIQLEQDEFFNPVSKTLLFDKQAKTLFINWVNQLTDISNASDSDYKKSIYSKIEQYGLRICLCFQMMKFACAEASDDQIDVESVESSITLMKYFTNSAFKARSKALNENPLDNLTKDKIDMYETLDDVFKTKDGVELAKTFNLSERTAKTFFNKKDLFIHNQRGEYQKKY